MQIYPDTGWTQTTIVARQAFKFMLEELYICTGDCLIEKNKNADLLQANVVNNLKVRLLCWIQFSLQR